ncbi:MAG: coproporphyrinogen III oxidase [Nitrospirales bacterium]|nr:MAG: coproporphyrinogen III oxidase [Nitrospirales bacterium]
MSDMEYVGNAVYQRLHVNDHIRDLGMYIHIPFCQKRCHFCAFYLTPHREDRVQHFLSAFAQEAALYALDGTCHRFPVSTIYFGGGTPTALEPVQLTTILNRIHRYFIVDPAAEITVEADPATVSRSGLQTLRDAGVTRLSFGVQSLDKSEWQRLGRLGEMQTITRAMAYANDVGFSNVSLDVMYGLPGQTLTSWQHSLEKILELVPTHVSCYALTIEEGTKFSRDITAGRMNGHDADQETVMHEQAIAYLEQAGYHQYEVSNFAQSGWECQHNLRYWSGLDYLGLGPSAQSYVGGMRFGNIADLAGYIQCLERKQLPVDSLDTLSMADRVKERVIFGLRMNKGVPTQTFAALNNDTAWQLTVDRLMETGLLSLEREHLKATSLGRRYMDSVACQLL